MGSVVGSRRLARTARQQPWARYGECPGHHRGLRAGHVSRGGTRERGRATYLLDDYARSGGPGDQRPWRGPGSFPQVTSPAGTPRTEGARKVSGSERQAKRPEKDRVAVVATHSTDERGEVRPKRPTGGKASSGRASAGRRQGRDIELTNPDHSMLVDCIRAAVALFEEPDAFIAHVRVCGRAGWVTTGSTRQARWPASARASLPLPTAPDA